MEVVFAFVITVGVSALVLGVGWRVTKYQARTLVLEAELRRLREENRILQKYKAKSPSKVKKNENGGHPCHDIGCPGQSMHFCHNLDCLSPPKVYATTESRTNICPVCKAPPQFPCWEERHKKSA